MRQPIDVKRRSLLMGAASLLTVIPVCGQTASLLPTPRQTSGPFYPLSLPLDDDNDLTRVSNAEGRALGEITDLTGRILDMTGQPLEGLRIEIWQCDANGRYRHPRERGSAPQDENFQGHGYTLTNDQGYYRFRTIRPVPYPGRAPHIHTAVFLPGQRPFVTQIYVKGEPRNADDFIFDRVSADRRHLLLADFNPAAADIGATLNAQFDLVLGATPGDA